MAGEDAASGLASGGDITQQLLAWSAGDQRAAAPAFAALYATLRRLAARALSGERSDHTLGTAGLIGEAFFRLLEQQRLQWRSREHFLATAAQMMRRILIDHARSRAAAKRGDGVAAVPLVEDELVPSDALGGLIPIHDALEALAAIDPARSELVELRFFGGMTHEEIASYLGVSLATVERRWRLARAWLYHHLQDPAA
jgi:RNA polymerase sigma-70 factor (ECF subfamily)